MKAGIWIAIVLVLIAGGALFFIGNETEVRAPLAKEASAFELLKNATFEVPDTDVTVTLENGSALFPVAPDSAAEGSVVVADENIIEWKSAARHDIGAIVAVNGGGTGVFVYFVLFDASDGTAKKVSEVFLGDRIGIERVGVGELVHGDADYRITVQTLERKEGESYAAAPTVPTTRTLYVKNGILEKVDDVQDDT